MGRMRSVESLTRWQFMTRPRRKWVLPTLGLRTLASTLASVGISFTPTRPHAKSIASRRHRWFDAVSSVKGCKQPLLNTASLLSNLTAFHANRPPSVDFGGRAHLGAAAARREGFPHTLLRGH